jgi:UDP-glucose 4-epimerase
MSGQDQPRALTGKRVLVTGGAGFIGSHLTRSLVEDNDVRVLDDLSTGQAANVPDDAELRVGDVRDQDRVTAAIDGVDVVFHEAAEISVEQSVDDPIRTNAVNADATLQLLEAARRADARVVLASSAAVYGHPNAVPVAETHPTAPTSPYGVSKLAADEYARLYESLYGLPTVALRYFNVYGPGQTGDYAGVVSAFLEQARRDDPITIYGDGDQTRDFVHVRDVVDANRRAATTDAVGDAFNVGTGRSLPIRELAEEIRDVVGADSPIVHEDARDGDVRHSRADVSKAREALGFDASVPLGEGLAGLARNVPA